MDLEQGMKNIVQRPRRLRGSEAIRALVRENRLQYEDLIMPVFIKAGKDIK